MTNVNDKVLLTQAGYDELVTERNNLINITRPEVIEQLQEARAQGDLSENADYDAARERQAQVEGRISEIQNMLDNSEIIKESKGGTKIIRVGSTVRIKDLDDDKEYVNTIVGSVEADPFNGRISNKSPLAEAIIGKKINDEIEVKVAKPYKVKIISIENK